MGHRWLPPLAQQRTYRWCTVGPPLGQRWLATGGPTEAHRWLATVGPTVGQQRPTGGYSHRWANRGSLDKPTVGHRWLPPLAQQRTYRWCTVGNRGPPVASHRWPNGGPTEAHRWLATGGPTEARWTNPQWATGGCHRWPISTRTVGPPLAHQSNAIWASTLLCNICKPVHSKKTDVTQYGPQPIRTSMMSNVPPIKQNSSPIHIP